MASAQLRNTFLSFTSDGTDINARITATDDVLTLQGNAASVPVTVNNVATLQLAGTTSGTLGHTVPAAVTSYTLTWPNAVGGANQVLTTDGSGNLSWNDVTTPSTISWKTSVVAATTVAGTLATSFANGQIIDGVTLTTGDRILIKNQASAVENGIYTVNVAGAPTRATDLDTGSSAAGAATISTEGTTNADTAWMCTTDAPNDIVGTDPINFSAFGSLNPISVAGVSGDIQYNNGSNDLAAATLSSYNFVDSATVPTLTVGVEDGGFFLNGADATTATSVGSAISITGGQGGSTSGQGGQITLTTGDGGTTVGDSGSLSLFTGTVTSGTSGAISLATGTGTTASGTLSISTGSASATTGVGGSITITSANGGSTSGDAGDVTITAGTAAGSGADGQIALVQNGNTYNWPVDTPAVGEILKVQAFAGNIADLEWATDTATAAGNSGDVQINEGGSLSAASQLNSGETIYNYSVGTPSNNDGILAVGATANSTAAASFALTGQDSTAASGFAGTSVSIISGGGDGAAAGGTVTATAGDGGATGSGGVININAGAGGSTSGAGGTVTINGGDSTTSGSGGTVTVTAGIGAGTGAGGNTIISAGDSGGGATGNGGAVTIDSGSAVSTNGTGGAISVVSGAGSGTGAGGNYSVISGQGGATGTGGSASITSGAGGSTSGNSGTVTIASGTVTSGTSGVVSLATGTGTTASGGVSISTGSASATTGIGGSITITSANGGSTSGDAGDVTITAGTAAGSGADGQIALVQNGNTYNWPVDTPAVGEILKVQAFAGNVADLEWATDTATPGGNDTEIQFNNAGVFGGADNFVIPSGETSTTLRVLDSSQIAFGTGDDLTISHNGTNSLITNTTGNLAFTNNALTSDISFTLGDSNAASNITFSNSGGVLVSINGDGPNSTSVTTGTMVITGGLGVSEAIYADEINATSDANFKKNIARIENPLDKIMAIEGYTYDWKADYKNKHGRRQIGVLAQQLEEIGLGDLVTGNDKQKAVNYLGLIPLLIEAMKELVNSMEVVDE